MLGTARAAARLLPCGPTSCSTALVGLPGRVSSLTRIWCLLASFWRRRKATTFCSSSSTPSWRFGWVAGIGGEGQAVRKQLDRAHRVSALRLRQFGQQHGAQSVLAGQCADHPDQRQRHLGRGPRGPELQVLTRSLSPLLLPLPARRSPRRRCASRRGHGAASISAGMPAMDGAGTRSTRSCPTNGVPCVGSQFQRLRRGLPGRRQLARRRLGRWPRNRPFRYRHQRVNVELRWAAHGGPTP